MLLLRQRGVAELIEFADGRLDLIGGFIAADAPVAGLTLAELRDRVTGWSWIVVAIVRDGETMVARGSTRVEAGDHVLFMAETDKADEALYPARPARRTREKGDDLRRNQALPSSPRSDFSRRGSRRS